MNTESVSGVRLERQLKRQGNFSAAYLQVFYEFAQ